MKTLLAALALFVISCDQGGPAAPVQFRAQHSERPLAGRVFDRANLLDPGAEQALTSKLAKLEEATSDQLVLVTLPNLGGEPIEKVALSLANRWGIGRKDVDNGVLILIAQSERKIRIEVGLGLEGLLTDARAAGVIRAMIPELREGEIGKAAMLAVDRIDLLLRSDTRRPQPEPVEEKAAA